MPKYIITKAPAPLDWARVSQPMMGTPRGMAITAGAPHPNAARLFVDYWLSRDAMKILAEKVGEYVLAPGDLSADPRARQGKGDPDPRAFRRRDQEVGRGVQEDLRDAVTWKSKSGISARTTIRKARRFRALDDVDLTIPANQDLHAPRAERLRQDHAAAVYRRPGDARLGGDRHRGRRRLFDGEGHLRPS